MSVNVLSAKKNDAKAVRRSDPLALDPEAHETKMMGKRKPTRCHRWSSTKTTRLRPSRPETGTWASITFRLSLIPERWPCAVSSHLDGKSALPRTRCSRSGHWTRWAGFSLLREGRELANGRTFT